MKPPHYPIIRLNVDDVYAGIRDGKFKVFEMKTGSAEVSRVHGPDTGVFGYLTKRQAEKLKRHTSAVVTIA